MFWNQIYQGDNIDYLYQMADEGMEFELILADLPYNVGKDFGNYTDRQDEKTFLDGINERLKIMKPLLARDGSIILFCSHLWVDEIRIRMKQLFQYRRMLIWYYKNGLSRQTKEPVTSYELILWYSMSDNFTYNMEDIRVPYKTSRVKNPCYKTNKRGDRVAWTANPNGAKRSDVWEYPVLSGKLFEDERTEHATQKPEDLMMDLIRAFCPKNGDKYNGRILDPYLGSGTTAVCCERLNRMGHKIDWVGIELEEKWVDIATDRVQKERTESQEVDILRDHLGNYVTEAK